ncbi:MAG: alpha/beta hydrolase [Bdellovibrionia bacterium]
MLVIVSDLGAKIFIAVLLALNIWQFIWDLNAYKNKVALRFFELIMIPYYFSFGVRKQFLRDERGLPHSFKVLRPPKRSNKKIIFQIHGGGFQHGGLNQFNHYNEWLKDMGFTVVVLDYPKIPKVNLEDQIAFLRESIDLVLKDLSSEKFEELYLSGRSAGAYLALAVANRFEAGKFRKIFCFYPIVDFLMIARESHQGDLLNWPWRLNALFSSSPNENLLASYSVKSFKNLQNSEIVVFHGERDPVVSVEQSRYLKSLAQEDNLLVSYHELAGQSHGFEVNLYSIAGQYCRTKITGLSTLPRIRQ